MSSQNFMNISRKECLEVYKEILSNSERKWNSAEILAENKDYGTAFSTAIISIEEIVKSMLLLLDGKGFELRTVKGIDTIFKNHRIRYFIAYMMLVFSVFGEDLTKLLIKYRNNPQLIVWLNERNKRNKGFVEKFAKRYFQNKLPLLINELDWFIKMDIFRQDGFYCDYDNHLKTPLNINENNYQEAIKRITKVREIGLLFIESYEAINDIDNKLIIKFNSGLKITGAYQKLGEKLSSFKPNKGPFDSLKVILQNIQDKLNSNN